MKSRLLCVAAIGTLALAGCSTTSPNYGGYGNYGTSYPSAPTACADCGIVTRIETVASGRTAPSATGAVLGGIVGAVAGREISDRTGGSKGNQNIAAVAGAVGGAMAGNKIQQNVTGNSYDIQVRMDDGRVVVVNQKDLNGIRESSYVRVVNGRVVPR